MSKYMITDVATSKVIYTNTPYEMFKDTKMYIELSDGKYLINETDVMKFISQNRTPIGVYDAIPTLVEDVTFKLPTLTHIISISDEIHKYILVYSDTERYEFTDFKSVKAHIAGISVDLAMLQIDESNAIHLSTSVDSLNDYSKAQIYIVDKTDTTMKKVCVMRVK